MSHDKDFLDLPYTNLFYTTKHKFALMEIDILIWTLTFSQIKRCCYETPCPTIKTENHIFRTELVNELLKYDIYNIGCQCF